MRWPKNAGAGTDAVLGRIEKGTPNLKEQSIIPQSPRPGERPAPYSTRPRFFGRGWAGQDNTAVAEMGVLNVEMAFNGP